MVNLTALIAGGTFLVTNFQGQALDLFGSNISLTPVAANSINGGTTQQWTFLETATADQYLIFNPVSGIFLSYPGIQSGATANHAQAVGTYELAFWNLTSSDSSGTSISLTESKSGLVLSAWSGDVSPITLELPGAVSAAQQTFSLSSP